MERHRARDEPIKGRRRKARKPKRRNAPKTVAPPNLSIAGKETEVARLTLERNEALEQLKATSNVLQLISFFACELDPVFQTILASATRICKAKYGDLYLFSDSAFRLVALVGPSAALAMERLRGPPVQPAPGTGLGRMLKTKDVVQIADVLTDQIYPHDHPLRSVVERESIRTLLCVPMIKKEKLIGAISIYRQEVRSFTDRQIELVRNFAAHAVIAIENARLLNELRQRTDDLTESLEQQTAASEILQVISSSRGDLEPVFSAMLENAVRICDAKSGRIYRWDGDALYLVAAHNTPLVLADYLSRVPIGHGGSVVARMAATRAVIHVSDLAADKSYVEHHPVSVAAVELGGVRTFLAVPMLIGNELIGGFALSRQEVRPFSDKQIELVTNFAAQAVIAIENARLLNELRQRTDDLGRSVGELRALGEVSQAVNSTLDLENVLSTIVAKAVELSGTEAGAIYVFDPQQNELRLRATYGMNQELIDALSRQHIGLEETTVAHALAQRKPVQITDLKEEPRAPLYEALMRAGFRAVLLAPLLRGDELVGLLVVRRRLPGAFPQNTFDLIKTFAAQSAVAIENARLFKSVETSLEDLRTAQDRLVQTQKLASLGQLTAGIAHEIKNPLNFVNNFSSVSVELIEELKQALDTMSGDEKTRSEITELANTLSDNLDKIVQHGKRADAIVKNMLLHSREGSGEHRLVDVNALVEESLNLAYHGARAEKQGFAITLERSFDPTAGEVDVFPQEITRVLLNLISNGFYAATKRKDQASGDGYEPTLTAATKNRGDRVEITIRDNGTGIPPEVSEKLFTPFFTTKPASEGTGLGLSISHDIIVKQHAGSLEVETEPGEFTEFKIILPRIAASLAKSGGRA